MGQSRMHGNALRNAGISPDEVQYVNAHGTSTPLGDKAETMPSSGLSAIMPSKLVVNSTKSMTGHLLGAAGGIEAVFSALAIYIRYRRRPSTSSIRTKQCDLDYCANEARQMKIDVGTLEFLRLRRHQRHAGFPAYLIPAFFPSDVPAASA
jgi:3-oxoacyl-[acyl-carrier-protein] synthase II